MNEVRLLQIAQKVAVQKYRRDLKWWQDNCHNPSTEEAPQYWNREIPDKVYSEILGG